jgi:hypothetical protein
MDKADVATCLICGNPRRPLKSVRYCSGYCRREAQRRKFLKRATTLPSGTIGAAHELLVSADLLAKGYDVYRAVSGSCPCDLAIVKDGKLLRVEVTTGYEQIDKTIKPPSAKLRTKDRWDILAIVVRMDNTKAIGDRIVYFPQIDELPQ